MITLDIPTDPQLLASVGKVALRHGQLDYVLRMTVKSILKLSIRDALDATDRQGSRGLRDRVRKLAKKRFGEGDTLVRLDALLARSRRATADRNEVLHSLWARSKDGEPIIRDDDGYAFRPVPTVAELEEMADKLADAASELNDARMNGFLKEALAESD